MEKDLTRLFDDLEVFSNDDNGTLATIDYSSQKQLFIETDNTTGVQRFYKMKASLSFITSKHRTEILDYCLGKGNYPKDEEVSIRDIYLWDGEYFEEVTLNELL